MKRISRAKDCEHRNKRANTSEDDWSEYIKLLQQDILVKEEQIHYKELRVGMGKNTKSWKFCDKLTGEIIKL